MNVDDLNQYRLGLVGMAFLRNWLTGDNVKNNLILDDLHRIISNLEITDKTTQGIGSYGVGEGYSKWASNYDDMPNMLIDAEEPELRKVIGNIKPGKAIDFACGTGRYSSILTKLGHRVTGVDSSKSMLDIAKRKVPTGTFINADIKDIPIQETDFDLGICALALTHFNKLSTPVREMARLIRPGGLLVFSDIHPMVVLLGGHADFQTKSGEHGFITNHVHLHSEYMQAFIQSHLGIVDCLEPKLKPKHTKIFEEIFNLNETTIGTALNGVPIALIWILKKLR